MAQFFLSSVKSPCKVEGIQEHADMSTLSTRVPPLLLGLTLQLAPLPPSMFPRHVGSWLRVGDGGCGANLCTAEVCITAVPSLNEEVGLLNILVCSGRSFNNVTINYTVVSS